MEIGRWSLLIAFLCATIPLVASSCDGNRPMTELHDGDNHTEEKNEGYCVKLEEAKYDSEPWCGCESCDSFEEDVDDPIQSEKDAKFFRLIRSIEASRWTDDSTKPGQRANLPKTGTKLSSNKRRFKNVTIGDGICSSVDIRNNVTDFEMMANCTVIEGSLQVVLLENYFEKDYLHISLPKLREITGYLLFYRVYGLKSLSNLFPNLEVIRGNTLLTDYSLMVYEMQNLQEIGLHKLVEVSRGGVRIEKNPALCYTNTLNWDLIVTAGENVIKDNGEAASCPGCSHCPGGYCWTSQYCQRLEKPKCHEQCVGECHGPTEKDCYVCKHYQHEEKCVEFCPSNLYAYLSRRCITKDECFQMNHVRRWNSAMEVRQDWRPFNGSCVTHCPDGYEDALDENNMVTCRACAICRRVSHGALIRHIADAQAFRGITVVKGALEFKIENGNPRIVMKELSEAFGRIEEITEYVRISYSQPITSLAFFKKLKVIKGEKLDTHNASLTIIDNANLFNLFPPEQKIRIENGRLNVHYNSKLCLSKIVKFGKMVNITNFTAVEVQSNGDKVACDVVNINMTVKNIGPDYADLIWENYKPSDGQKLLSYLLHYIETDNVNITYETNVCGGDNTWQIVDVAIPKQRSNTVSQNIKDLKPYTNYAVYVKTFNSRNTKVVENVVGQSRIIFFRTKSAVPTAPTKLASMGLSDTNIIVKWKPPKYPNGLIGYYMLSVSRIYENDDLLSFRDYCINPLEPEIEDPEIAEDFVTSLATNDKNSCCLKNSNAHVASEKLQIFCHENNIISHISPGWKDHCRYNDINNGLDEQTKVSTALLEIAKLDSSNSIGNVVNENKVIYNISGQSNSFVIRNLHYYTRYVIKVAACGVKINDSEICSSTQYTHSRTKRREYADDVYNVRVLVKNNSIAQVLWDEVKNPNALTVSYTIEYTNLDVKDAKKSTECIPCTQPRDTMNSYVIKNLSPGSYSLRVRSTSLAGNGAFSEVVYFGIGMTSTAPFTIVASVILFVLFVMSIVLAVLLRNHQKRKQQERLFASVNPDYMETKYVIDEWEVPRESLEILEDLGLGNFGMVYRGIYDKTTPVAVKTISPTANQREKNEFLNEASVMKNFSTFHIIRLIGVVSIESPPYVIMELMENGDLKTYLRRIRDTRLVPDACRIMRMAAEIADGMAYLESKKYVHRDLAARNCMVSRDLVCKIGDFGMARDVYETDYYKIGQKGLLPIRWMAPESLSDGVFTSDSDVWSFGVVLYEILTLAEIPYQGFSNDDVMQHVVHRGKLNIPRNCPENIQKIIEKCFKWRPSERPTFMEIVSELEPFLGQDFYEKSFYHSMEGVESRNSGLKKPYHHAAPIRFHWGNESARWVKECEDNVTLLDQTKAGTSKGRIFKNGFQPFGNVSNMEDVPLDR